ncbi:MAG: ABC-F family ATP-binding cassette domain-containing protein [candidate division Zixibacteria bacterium]|nr:ABC-F family ATP-binding cassette domain-containing protein [candidate division Zixibacteria bacterium]
MTLLVAENISKRFSDQIILDQISFTIKTGDHIGLVGKNGIGKTTLFEILIGNMEVDSGSITHSRSCAIDYIAQDKTAILDLSLFEYVASARQDLLDMRFEIGALEEHLAQQPSDTVSLDRLGYLQPRFEALGGFTFEHEVSVILHGLGFEKNRHSDRIANFSGGEKNRVGLARSLAGRGNLLLLDEPTNHLDIESTIWLEEYLNQTDKCYLVISHDRTFLTNTVRQIWDIQFGKLHIYKGGFEHYLSERKERQRLHEHHYKHQQEEIKRIEEYIRRNMAGQKTKQAQSKLKYLSRIKRLPAPRSEGKGPNIHMQSSGRSYARVLEMQDVTLGYGSDTVVSDISFDLYRGDKVGLIGRNGSGKTTVLHSLTGDLSPVSGEIRLGNNVNVAYFDQELTDLVPNATALDTIWELEPTADSYTIRSFLARFGFFGEDCFKMVKTLSGGEKTKLSMARLLYHPANFLIFDEPTNHLDLDSREALEEALRDYDGSCLIVSHDRHFLNRVVDRIFYLNDGRMTIYNGNYSYFEKKMTEAVPSLSPKPVKSKGAYLAFKEKSRQKSRHKKAIQSTRSKINDLEKELANLDEDIHQNIPRSDWEQLDSATHRKFQIEDNLLELYATLEQLEETKID